MKSTFFAQGTNQAAMRKVIEAWIDMESAPLAQIAIVEELENVPPLGIPMHVEAIQEPQVSLQARFQQVASCVDTSLPSANPATFEQVARHLADIEKLLFVK